jgi:hypothetical protein
MVEERLNWQLLLPKNIRQRQRHSRHFSMISERAPSLQRFAEVEEIAHTITYFQVHFLGYQRCGDQG